jgi:hypothetical protein
MNRASVNEPEAIGSKMPSLRSRKRLVRPTHSSRGWDERRSPLQFGLAFLFSKRATPYCNAAT